MNINELREQICGKEPVANDFNYFDDFAIYHRKWTVRCNIFNRTAAAILELVKERVPGEASFSPYDSKEFNTMLAGRNAYRKEILTTIENLKNELKCGKEQ